MNKSTPPLRGIAGPNVAAGVRPGVGVLGLARADSAVPEAAEEDTLSQGRLIVGEGIHVKGEIQSCRNLIVEGTVEASLEARELTVSKGGVYSGSAAVETAAIDGRFDGDLTVEGLLTIQAGGRVTGKLRYRNLKIEEGGRLSGDIDLLEDLAAGEAPEKTAQRPAPAVSEERLLESAAAR